MINNADIREGFLVPLKQISNELQVAENPPRDREKGEGQVEEEGEGKKDEDEGLAREMDLLDATIEIVENAMKNKGL